MVTTIEFPLFTVGGDKILLIEKLRLDPPGAVVLMELVNKTCWLTVMHDKMVDRKLLVERRVQPWVAVVIIGGKEELAESDQTEGKFTKIEPFACTWFPKVIVIVISLVVWTVLGVKLAEHDIKLPGT